MEQQEQPCFLYEIFDAALPRLAPGSDEVTQKALNTLLAAQPGGKVQTILDLGCGNGAQTLQLARHTTATVIAVDNHQPFLDELQRRARAQGLEHRIQTLCADMQALEFSAGTFDLIWAEGSLYIMGFEQGLQMCRRLLKPGGLLGASEICWLRGDPPAPCRDFWESECPFMKDVQANLDIIASHGYQILNHFPLSESAWMQNYYAPLDKRLKSLRTIHAGHAQNLAMIESVQEEIDLYRQYGSYYGYEFFLMQRG